MIYDRQHYTVSTEYKVVLERCLHSYPVLSLSICKCIKPFKRCFRSASGCLRKMIYNIIRHNLISQLPASHSLTCFLSPATDVLDLNFLLIILLLSSHLFPRMSCQTLTPNSMSCFFFLWRPCSALVFCPSSATTCGLLGRTDPP